MKQITRSVQSDKSLIKRKYIITWVTAINTGAVQNLNRHTCASTSEKGKTCNVIKFYVFRMQLRLMPVSGKLSKLPTQGFTANARLTQHKFCHIYILHDLH